MVWLGFAASVALFLLILLFVSKGTRKTPTFTFEKNPGDFERLLPVYLDIAKFVLTLAAGGIVLIISSTALGSSSKRLPPAYINPLSVLVMSILFGILFMPFLTLSYEAFRQETVLYTRAAYIRNQTLGFSALGCFCLGYAWLIVAAIHG